MPDVLPAHADLLEAMLSLALDGKDDEDSDGHLDEAHQDAINYLAEACEDHGRLAELMSDAKSAKRVAPPRPTGTELATELLSSDTERSVDWDDYKERVKGVAEEVAAQMGVEPLEVLRHIDPTVFLGWRPKREAKTGVEMSSCAPEPTQQHPITVNVAPAVLNFTAPPPTIIAGPPPAAAEGGSR